MDMAYMEAGKVPKDLPVQLDELAEIKRQYPDNILPFIAVDPRRPGIADMVKKYVEEHDFAGIKLYPPLGYYPFDSRLDDVYEYAQARQLPIISHCAGGVVYYRGRITDDMLDHPLADEWNLASKRKKNKEFCKFFAHPENYRYVLKKYPDLKICLAHAGGSDEWKAYLDGPWRWPPEQHKRSWLSIILDMFREFPTLYADISYLAHDKEFHPLLKVRLQDETVRPRVLFGSDFYMVQKETSERAFSVNLRSFLGEADYRQIAEINPATFLATKPRATPRRRPD
jgi:predicted TIM-barrel fold metal-dependent hydrolase